MVRLLQLLTILLKMPPRSQIMPTRSQNYEVLYPSHEETLSLVIFGKIGGPC